MIVRIFERPVEGQPFKRIGISQRMTGEYEFSFYDYGRFTLSIHPTAQFSSELQKDRIVEIDGIFWGIIKNRKIQRGGTNLITVSGYQLKGLLWQRTTVPLNMPPSNAPAGFDSQQGSTEKIIKYFIGNNTQGIKRFFESFKISPNENKGFPTDTYFTRFEVLGDVISKLGKRVKLGWDIVGDDISGTFTLITSIGADRTAQQCERSRVVFDLALGTLSDFELAEERENAANVFYCTKSGAEFEDEALTQTYYLDDIETVGIERIEKHLNISISDDEDLFTKMRENAQKEMENYRENITISCTATERLIFGKDYFVGDTATFRSTPDSIEANRQITAVKVVVTENTVRHVITMGEPRINKFDYIDREIKNR